jgi:peroxiredoxin
MRLSTLLITALLMNTISCSGPETKEITKEGILQPGVWRGALNIGEENTILEVPFNFEVISNEKIIIHNGEERIEVTDISIDSNQISIKMPVFGSEFRLSNKNNKWEGLWYNYNKKNYRLPFKAETDNKARFALNTTRATLKLAKRWKVTFSPNTEDAYPAIGMFESDENGKVTGTFLTETGDYRYLEGVFDGQHLNLSCFDGAHVFLFRAEMQKDGKLSGDFWSGKHWHEKWEAKPDEHFQLAEMDKLTYLKEGYDKLSFSFPDSEGRVVSLTDEQFRGKAVIVQITGSWCPNCMDETRFLMDIYNEYHTKGLEIVAIDYEKSDNIEVFKSSKQRMQEHLGLEYTMLFGGKAKKSEAIKTWPMLNHLMSYPTTIFIDRTGRVQKIHTGFSGPGTGAVYKQYVEKTTALIKTLVLG